MSETRERIMKAAKEIMVEEPDKGPSVRAVANRAGIGASTLRHYFPTQRALYDAIYSDEIAKMMGDLRIEDTSVPARERLMECMAQVLPPVQPGLQSLEYWVRTLSGASRVKGIPEAQESWGVSVRQVRARVGHWLDVLAAEGVVRDSSRDRQIRFLLAVVDGLAIGRIVPHDHLTHEQEQAVLSDAVDAVLIPS